MNSPLLFPVRLNKDKILVLDETVLPFKEEYLEVDSLDKALFVLAAMKTRSLGQVLLFFYSCLLFEKDFSIEEISGKFKQSRPTFDFLFLARILRGKMEKQYGMKESVDAFVFGFDKQRRMRAKKLATVLPDPAKILTLCNVNGELIYLYEELRKINKQACFVICETRPYLQGSRLTFWELDKNNIPCKLICDNQCAAVMRDGLVNCVVIGADRATAGGDIVNKIGTYPLACLAKYFRLPVYPLTQYPRNIDVESIEIEERPAQEVFMFIEEDCSLIEAVYPAFDITKKDFITECMELTSFS